MQDDAVRRRELAYSRGRRGDAELAVTHRLRVDSGLVQERREPRGVRAAHDRGARRHRLHLAHRGLTDEPAFVDDHHVVDRLGDLGEEMARDEHGSALAREHAQEVAKPANALRIEPVCRLVENERLRVPQ